MNKEIKLPVRKYQVGAAVALGSALATLAGGAGAYYGSKELKDLIESGNLSGAASYIKDKTSNLFSGAKAMAYSDLARIMKSKDDFSSLFSLSGYNPSVLYDEATKQAGESTTARRRGRPRKNQGSTTGEAAGETAATVPATTETAPTDSASVVAPAITGQASSDSTRTQPATPRQSEEQQPENKPENEKKDTNWLKKQLNKLKREKKRPTPSPRYESTGSNVGKYLKYGLLGLPIATATIPGLGDVLGYLGTKAFQGIESNWEGVGRGIDAASGVQPVEQDKSGKQNKPAEQDTVILVPINTRHLDL